LGPLHRVVGVESCSHHPSVVACRRGCHPNRDTAAAIEAAGFRIEEIDRFSYAPLRLFPKHTHVLGRCTLHWGPNHIARLLIPVIR
jgi:hypothetical protein